jgi:hypothetical protein
MKRGHLTKEENWSTSLLLYARRERRDRKLHLLRYCAQEVRYGQSDRDRSRRQEEPLLRFE